MLSLIAHYCCYVLLNVSLRIKANLDNFYPFIMLSRTCPVSGFKKKLGVSKREKKCLNHPVQMKESLFFMTLHDLKQIDVKKTPYPGPGFLAFEIQSQVTAIPFWKKCVTSIPCHGWIMSFTHEQNNHFHFIHPMFWRKNKTNKRKGFFSSYSHRWFIYIYTIIFYENKNSLNIKMKWEKKANTEENGWIEEKKEVATGWWEKWKRCTKQSSVSENGQRK